MTQRTIPLQDQLDEITARTRKLVQAERLAVGERAVEELFATGIEERILPVGAVAPEFELRDSANRVVRSRDLLAVGPLVVKFFRGRWCPYCVTELEAWRDLYGQLRERGALLVGISPETQRQSDFAVQQHGIPFPLLHDPGAKVAERFGLVYTVPAAGAGDLRRWARWPGGLRRGACRFPSQARAVGGPGSFIPGINEGDTRKSRRSAGSASPICS